MPTLHVSAMLEAIDTAMGVIKTLADTPGINMLPYANTVSGAITAIRVAYTAGVNVASYVKALTDTFSGGVPTQEQIDVLDAKIAELEAKVHAPLPPREDGEPE